MRSESQSNIVDYITEEVWRQGHDTSLCDDGLIRVSWMLEAWNDALKWAGDLDIDHIRHIGRQIERIENVLGFRKCAVFVGVHEKPHYSLVPNLLENLLAKQYRLKPLEFYREFEEIHPFVDGNGRTGKILLNYLNKTMLNPIFPPNDFWGRVIRNP